MRPYHIVLIFLFIALGMITGFRLGESTSGGWQKVASDYLRGDDLKNLQVSDYEWANGLLASHCRSAGLQIGEDSTLQVYLLPGSSGPRLEFWCRRDGVEIKDAQLDQINQIALKLLREAQAKRK
ncbi:MAG: hypothetical protein RL095_1668 [Verrucomicrobiota bacterium]